MVLNHNVDEPLKMKIGGDLGREVKRGEREREKEQPNLDNSNENALKIKADK